MHDCQLTGQGKSSAIPGSPPTTHLRRLRDTLRLAAVGARGRIWAAGRRCGAYRRTRIHRRLHHTGTIIRGARHSKSDPSEQVADAPQSGHYQGESSHSPTFPPEFQFDCPSRCVCHDGLQLTNSNATSRKNRPKRPKLLHSSSRPYPGSRRALTSLRGKRSKAKMVAGALI